MSILYSFSHDTCIDNRGKVALEIVPWETELIVGAVQDRLNDHTSSFQATSFTFSFPFPIILSAGYKKTYSDTTRKNNNFEENRITWIRPIISFGLTTKEGNFLSLGNKFAFPIAHIFSINYQIAIAWVEGDINNNDGLQRGLNFYHNFSLSKKISKRIRLSINAQHISNGNMFGDNGANFNSYGVGVSYILNQFRQ